MRLKRASVWHNAATTSTFTRTALELAGSPASSRTVLVPYNTGVVRNLKGYPMSMNMKVEGTELVIRVDVSKLAQLNAAPSASGKTRILANARFAKVEAAVCPGLQVNAVVLCDPAPAKGAKAETVAPTGDAAAIAILAKLGLGEDQIAKLLAKAAPAPTPVPAKKTNGRAARA